MTSSWMRRCKRKKRKSIVSLEWIQSHLCHSTPKKSRKVIESEDEQEDKEESEAESEHTIRPLKFVDDEAEEVDEGEEEQEDDEDAQPRKRKLIKGIRPPSPEEDEEEDLLNEVDENSAPRPLQIRPLLILMLLIHRNGVISIHFCSVSTYGSKFKYLYYTHCEY